MDVGNPALDGDLTAIQLSPPVLSPLFMHIVPSGIFVKSTLALVFDAFSLGGVPGEFQYSNTP